MEAERRRGHAVSWHWPLLLAIFMLNIFLPSLLSCYGVIFIYAVNYGVDTRWAMCTPTLFLLMYCLSQSWCRDIADSCSGNFGYRMMATFGLVVVVASLVCCGFVPYHVIPILYGGIGGIGSSLISAQVDAVIFETYDTRLGMVKGLCLTGQAIGQAVFPHIFTMLVNYYGYSLAHVVLGAILLQTLPAIMFLKTDETIRPESISRYSDLAKSHSTNSNVYKLSGNVNELQAADFPKNWKSPDSSDNNEELEMNDILSDSLNTTTVTPPPSPDDKWRHLFGIEILPDIPEESEESDDDEMQSTHSEDKRKRFSNAIKRLSTIGDDFDEYIMKQSRRESEVSFSNRGNASEFNVTYDNISPITDVQRERVLISFSLRFQASYSSIKRKLRLPSYRVYRLKRRVLYLAYSFNDTFLKPLTRSLSTWQFYPALLLGFVRLALFGIYLTLIPMRSLQVQPNKSMTETNFMMSLHAFAMLSFLSATPWLAKMPKRNFKYIVIVGLLICTGTCYVILQASSYDAISIGCVVAGLGFGAVSSCWEAAAQDLVGAHKWGRVHSCLEVLASAALAALVAALAALTEQDGGLNFCFLVLLYIMVSVTVIWIFIAAFYLFIEIRSIRSGRLLINTRCL